LLHRADKSRSRHRNECGDGFQLAHTCPEGAIRCCSDMANKRLRPASLPGRQTGGRPDDGTERHRRANHPKAMPVILTTDEERDV